MKRWKVKIPGGKMFEITSDTPHEDLAAQGCGEYALEELFETTESWKTTADRVYTDERIDYTEFLSDKPLEKNPNVRKTMRKVALKALRERGVQATTIRLRYYANGRVLVYVDGEYYGVFDTNKGEFFSGYVGD